MRRDDYLASIGLPPLPAGGESYAMMDDMGGYSDPDAVPMKRSGGVFAIRPQLPMVCLGMACGCHPRCERYEAVNGSDPDEPRMATCFDGTGFPGFGVK